MDSQVWFKTNWKEAKTNYKLPTKKRMNKECLEIWNSKKSISVKYSELESEGMGDVVKRLRKYFGVKDWDLLGVMNDLSEWRKEVKDYYNKKNWFLYEWYYPLQISVSKKLKK
jgi:hypothetical protein